MFGSAKKVPTSCPHCGFVQLEPRELISTYCRGCGDHYTVAPQLPAKPALAERLREKLHIQRRHFVACHECGHEQAEPAHIRSTNCSACGAGIDLHDIEIAGHSTRVVQTRGTVHVGRDGFLNSTCVDCGNAIVEGRIAGKVTCAGTLRLKGEGLCRAQIRTRQLLIDRGANLRFTHTIYADEIVFRGRVEADVQCAGTLHIGRYGGLEGDVLARAMLVDKGGAYSGAVEIFPAMTLPAPPARDRSEVRVAPAWLSPRRLAFG